VPRLRQLILEVDRLLRRGPERGAGQLPLWIAFIFLGGFFYGAVMGSFSGLTGDRIWQVIYSGLKVPLLLLVSFVVALPSFFVLNTLMGVRADFAEALYGLVYGQAGLALVLVSLSPYTLLWYASSADYEQAILFNGVMFAVASLTAQGILRRSYKPLLGRRPRHRWLLRTWVVLYVFVGIQMAWVLRPFIGDPALPAQFFREESWGNAYVVIGRMIGDVFKAR
jgi:hypothetical protein